MTHISRLPGIAAIFVLFAFAAMPAPVPAQSPEAIPSPSQFLKLDIGADRTLADYRQIASYFRMLGERSPRVQIENLGKTTLGEEMLMAVISSEANLENLDRIKQISRRLADPRGLSDAEASKLADEGKAVLLITCNIHSNEIASSQMAMQWAHALATAQDAETRRRLDEVVLLLVPSLNPDGQIMETEWYRKYVGTKYEGSPLPYLYHHYVGHDNNRDWFMLTQKETRALTRAIYHEWFPQVLVDEHQMGSSGPRMFIPPFSDPLDEDVHPLIWREINLIGAHMAFRLEQQQKAGLIYGYSFDGYWIGGVRNTVWWKNITGLLLEVASARFATPLYVDPVELRGGGKGLAEYSEQINHPNPWPGGWWRLGDIIAYERIASDAVHELCADMRQDLLRNLLTRARAAIARAEPREAYRIPAMQRDYPSALELARLMRDHNVEVFSAETGDLWIPLAQPYGPFVREMFEVQHYPEIRPASDAEPLRPYDVAAWTLPLMMGVEVESSRLPEKGLRPFDGAADPRGTPGLPKAGLYALASGSPERARVVNAALKGGGSVRVIAPTGPEAGAETTAGGGMVLLDERAARAAAAVAAETGVRLEGVSSGPPAATAPLRIPRVGLYKPWVPSMDEGWTRWVLERYGFEPVTIDNRVVQKGGLEGRFDAIVLPDIDEEVLKSGRRRRSDGQMTYVAEQPPEYKGGLEREGADALKKFVEEGGTLVAMASATEYVIDQFNIPVRNALANARSNDFASPGSLVRVHVDPHPVTQGLPREMAVFLDSSIAFETTAPGAEMERWVLARYPEEGRDVLMSGWIRGEDRLTRRAAAVAVTYGKGRIVLIGFRPQYRGQTHATYPFLFNALYWSVMPR